jgi:hypothetical protein
MTKSRDASKERYWREVIRRWKASGLEIRRFCKREGVSENCFHWWRRTLQRRDPDQGRRPPRTKPEEARRDKRLDKSPFVPVSLPIAVAEPVEVVHPRGHVLRVPARFDAHALSRLLAAIDASAHCVEES